MVEYPRHFVDVLEELIYKTHKITDQMYSVATIDDYNKAFSEFESLRRELEDYDRFMYDFNVEIATEYMYIVKLLTLAPLTTTEEILHINVGIMKLLVSDIRDHMNVLASYVASF